MKVKKSFIATKKVYFCFLRTNQIITIILFITYLLKIYDKTDVYYYYLFLYYRLK